MIVSARGFGYSHAEMKDNYTWVLSPPCPQNRMQMPFQYEDFTIWELVGEMCTAFSDIVNFALSDKKDEEDLVIIARSVWAMINLNTRKPADLLTSHGR